MIHDFLVVGSILAAGFVLSLFEFLKNGTGQAVVAMMVTMCASLFLFVLSSVREEEKT